MILSKTSSLFFEIKKSLVSSSFFSLLNWGKEGLVGRGKDVTGRKNRSKLTQALCFLAGANSIFTGEKLLTQPNPSRDEDKELLEILGLKSKLPAKDLRERAC